MSNHGDKKLSVPDASSIVLPTINRRDALQRIAEASIVVATSTLFASCGGGGGGDGSSCEDISGTWDLDVTEEGTSGTEYYVQYAEITQNGCSATISVGGYEEVATVASDGRVVLTLQSSVANGDSYNETIQLDLVFQGDSVSGTGSYQDDEGSATLTINGTRTSGGGDPGYTSGYSSGYSSSYSSGYSSSYSSGYSSYSSYSSYHSYSSQYCSGRGSIYYYSYRCYYN